ncbi:hypothetical protein ACWGRF_13800 [Streptomyces zhihengii]
MDTAMLSQRYQHGILVITIHDDPAHDERADLTRRLAELMRAHHPAPVVVVIADAACSASTATAVRRAHRRGRDRNELLSVVTHSAPVRRLLQAGETAARHRMVIHPRMDVALAATSQACSDQAGAASAEPLRLSQPT